MLDMFAAAPTSRPAHTPRSAHTSRPVPTPPPAHTGVGTGGGESPFGPVVVSLEVFGWKPTVASLRTLGDLLEESRGGLFAAAAVAVMEELPRWTSSEAGDVR